MTNLLTSIVRRLSSGGTYKDGKKEGPWVSYHPSGQLYKTGTYKDGKKEGPWVEYDEDGQLYKTGTYKDGNKISD